MPGLSPSWTWGSIDLTAAPYAFGFGSDLGAPQTATEALAQLLDDGEIEINERASNRTLVFTVFVTEAADLLVQAQAEAGLAIEAGRARNTLAFDPGDGIAPVTVFETFEAQMVVRRADSDEKQVWREYEITCKAAPFSRSKGLVVSPAVPAPATPTIQTINAADSLPGWSVVPSTSATQPPGSTSTLSDRGDYLRMTTVLETEGMAGRYARFRYTPAAPVDLSATPLISLLLWSTLGDSDVSSPFTPSLKVNGQACTLVAAQNITSTRRRYYWQVPAGTTSVNVFDFATRGETTDPVAFQSLQRTDSVPSVGTARQRQRSVDVAGSARTRGSLALEHGTAALGTAMLYTWPNTSGAGYSPPLRTRRVSGGTTTTDPALVSGASDNIDTPLVFDVPVAALIEGTHLLLARVRSDTASEQTVNFSAQLRQGSQPVGPAITGWRVVPFGTTGTWRNVVLGRLALPPVGVPVSSTAVVRIAIAAASAAASNIDLDEAWLFNTSVGDLTWVECGTGTPASGGPSNRLWVDTATLDLPRPMIYRGTAADRSDAYHPGTDVLSFGTHQLEPGVMNVFSVTSGALNANVKLSHYPSWHTHAAL